MKTVTQGLAYTARRLLRKARVKQRDDALNVQRMANVSSGPMRVILFIGHHKVGSTSLQDYLARNAVVLAQHGILYPFVDFQGLAHFSAVAAGQHKVFGSLPINVREPHNALAFKMMAAVRDGSVPSYHKRLPSVSQMQNAITQQVAFSRPHTVILAAEVFANFPAVDESLAENIRDLFPDATFTLVATLRRIDNYIASWHGQRLKFGHSVEPLRETGAARYFNTIHFDYRMMVEGWLKALPDCDVILRNYDDVIAAGGSVQDFVSQTGLTIPSGMTTERHENTSLHRGIYEIVRRANRELPRPAAATLRDDLRDLCLILDLPSNGSIELYGETLRKQMLERFRDIDAWLAATVGQSAFFGDLESIAKTSPVPEMDAYAASVSQIAAKNKWSDDRAAVEFLNALKQGIPA
jgi:hypothetical protein